MQLNNTTTMHRNTGHQNSKIQEIILEPVNFFK